MARWPGAHPAGRTCSGGISGAPTLDRLSRDPQAGWPYAQMVLVTSASCCYTNRSMLNPGMVAKSNCLVVDDDGAAAMVGESHVRLECRAKAFARWRWAACSLGPCVHTQAAFGGTPGSTGMPFFAFERGSELRLDGTSSGLGFSPPGAITVKIAIRLQAILPMQLRLSTPSLAKDGERSKPSCASWGTIRWALMPHSLTKNSRMRRLLERTKFVAPALLLAESQPSKPPMARGAAGLADFPICGILPNRALPNTCSTCRLRLVGWPLMLFQDSINIFHGRLFSIHYPILHNMIDTFRQYLGKSQYAKSILFHVSVRFQNNTMSKNG